MSDDKNHQSIAASLAIMSTLIWRHTKKLRQDFLNILIDASLFVGLQVLELAYFIPALTGNTHTIAATAVGSALLLLISSGYKTMYPISHEIEHGGTLRYFLSLPIHPSLVFLSYIFAFAVEFFSFGVPSIAGALWIQRAYLHLTPLGIVRGIAFLCVCLLFFGTFFVTIVLTVSSKWYRSNVWARILGPCAAIGPLFVQWHAVWQHSRILGMLLLLNPFTYVTEGLRSALLQLPHALPVSICTLILFGCMGILWFILHKGIQAKMDPVL